MDYVYIDDIVVDEVSNMFAEIADHGETTYDKIELNKLTGELVVFILKNIDKFSLFKFGHVK